MNAPAITIETQSNVPLTAWATVNGERRMFVCDEQDAIDAGYTFNPKGLARKWAYEWACKRADEIKAKS